MTSSVGEFDRRTCVYPSIDPGVGVVAAAGEYCLVATRQVPAGRHIFRIEGDLMQQPSRHSLQVGYHLHMDLSDGVTMEEILDRYYWRFMNHSCEPTAVVCDRDVIAARTIEPWEPVTFDYTTTEWEMAEPFACGCGSAQCQGQVQGYRFLTETQRSRLGTVAAHLARHMVEASRR